MLAFIARRLLRMIPIAIGVTLLVFLMYNVIGDDPVRIVLGDHATPETIAELRRDWGLDQPLYMQYLRFLQEIVTLDFGRSYVTGDLITEMFERGFAVSLALTVPPFLAGLFLNLSLAIAIAYNRGSWIDRFANVFFASTMSVSYLVYIIVFQYVFSYHLGLFPINGYDHGWNAITYLSLPWIIIIFVTMGNQTRLFRTVFLDETKSDYVRTALAKGASRKRVMFKHILKNSMIPVLTYTVVEVPALILGAFLMERYFSIPGVGDYLISSITTGDFPMIKGITAVVAVGFMLFNLLTDILYAVVDPRVQLE